MIKNNFYFKQSNLTVAKIDFYKEYIEKYLAKILMTYGNCFIADLFCGPGECGDKKGSPIVLIDKANYILNAMQLKDRNVEVFILFNDENRIYIENLDTILCKTELDRRIKILDRNNETFTKIKLKIVKQLENNNIPKFFFLDPFTYSIIKIEDLKELMNLKKTEVLLFLPVFQSYRFANSKEFNTDHKTRQFIEEYTIKGMCDYINISDFMSSIKLKLMQKLSLSFIRPILLDGGSTKHSLFLLTKHEDGMLLMNNLCIKKSKDGAGINIRENYEEQNCLFDNKILLRQTSRYKNFRNNLINFLKVKKETNNKEVKSFVIKEEFRPTDAKDILNELRKKKYLTIFDSNKQISNKFSMSENISDTYYFKYNPETR